jgi:surface protein
MGKKLIIPGADFSANAIEITTFKTVSPNTAFQIKDSRGVLNLTSDEDGLCEYEGEIQYTGGSTAINLFNISTNTGTPNIESVSGLRLNTSDLRYAFGKCSNLKYVSIADIEAASSIAISSMFIDCPQLETVVFPKNSRINVTILDRMFLRNSSLTKLDMSMFDTSAITTITEFVRVNSGIHPITEVNCSGWDLAALDISVTTNYQYAFGGCRNLKKVIINNCNSDTIAKLKVVLATSGLTYTEGTDSQGNSILVGA